LKLNLGSVGEIIAERKFVLGRDGHAPTDIQALACGVDAFQAMQLAMGTIGVPLEVMGRESGGTMAWDAGMPGDLGFPISR